MKPKDRYEWILDWIQKNGNQPVDVLNQKFSDDYLEKTKANFSAMFYGAHKCSQLGRDLSAMKKSGLLERFRVGIPMAGWGFPKWVYSYSVKKGYK